jgi:hypothetical protein
MNARFRYYFISLFLLVLCIVNQGFAQTGATRRVLIPAVTSTGKLSPAKHSNSALGQLSVYDHGDPTNEEQYELELINRARANTHAEGDLLFNTTNPYLVQNRSSWGSPTAAQVKSAFYTYANKPPLAFNKDLITAARIHSQDMLDHNYQAHDSQTDGSSPFTRMTNAGYTGYDFAGENIFAYGNDLDEINQEFEYDFGNPGLGHRENLINFGNFTYTEIGIGILYGGTGSPNVGPIVTTEDFGHIPGNNFITGVVYGDNDHDNFYTIGEGLAGVTITASNGWTAVSSSSGGYAIPITDAGSVTLTASGGPLDGDISQTVNVDNENVKVDFIQGSTGFPAPVSLISPIADVSSDTVIFKWKANTPAPKHYHLQLSTDQNFKTLLIDDKTLTVTSKQYNSLSNGTKYYWRVQAENEKGWGAYSASVSFTDVHPSGGVTLVGPVDKANVGAGNDVKFYWNDGTGFVEMYWLEVSTSKTFATTVISDSVSFATSPGIVFADQLAQFTTYYWRVRYKNEKGWSAPSQVWSFVTGIEQHGSVTPSTSSPFQIVVSPNPTSGETHIRFTLDNASDVSLKIFGLSGTQVSAMNLGKLPSDKYEIIWNAANKPAGIYYYELTAGDKRETGRIVVVK